MKINRGDYPKLHLDTNYNKGTVCNRKRYGCKWIWETIKHSTWTQIIVKEHRCYCSATFGSLGRVFNNEHNSYPKVRETALTVERYSMIFAIYNCIAQMRVNQHENKIRGNKYRYDCAWHLLVRNNMDVIEMVDNSILH
jgi:hypothetical protein